MKTFTFRKSEISGDYILCTVTEDSATNCFHILVSELYREDLLKILNKGSINNNTE